MPSPWFREKLDAKLDAGFVRNRMERKVVSGTNGFLGNQLRQMVDEPSANLVRIGKVQK